MTASGALRTAEVAAATGYSTQQVRDLERLGVVPAAVRAPNGYRVYAPVHVHALRAYRALAGAVGPVAARRLLGELWRGTVTEAAAAFNAVHARLAGERDEALRARAALRTIQAEEGGPDPGADQDAMTITQLAGALGVRTSTLRFWEREGLVRPERVTSQRVRRYGVDAVAAARMVVALRGAGYGVPAVREVMESLRTFEGVAHAERILERRLAGIGTRTVALMRAGADLAAVVDAVGTPGAR
ncbi:MerR family transcriptional regulator [Streptomyces alkaliterrae]|uniref:MerR family transcriptional regulator n=1 Tax=Streptomyces alkaliterrae TaxID=2213162 RepID=A0A5P0YNH9_9ACTN|nr:MerR family transcriptional regulator [Streptomyces alkaliterrae]MBB1253936.1 MerR family transcriptional regulator [Streptomyces alkaliterrae]MBB1260068.1 MerR family transcriptional regulator [Streptomyces alkaliterrae]MQS01227.1 MerR family transcriptional regulator [Streptomyces alkaliterrae]